MIRYSQFVVTLVFLLIPSKANAWSAMGHHVIAVVAYEAMDTEIRSEVMRILGEHPDFEERFAPPNGLTDPAAIARWQIGIAGCWPDIIRGTSEDRPTWHYQLGASLVIGDVPNVPADPGPLPEEATLADRKLYIMQAMDLAANVFRDNRRSDAERAIALCWLLHNIGDIHQPCHAGSLYAPEFPRGDRGANSIELQGGSNLHATWDGLLGSRASSGEVRRRVLTLASVNVGRVTRDWFTPAKWLSESRDIGKEYVYTQEITQPVIAASRGLTDGVPKLSLSKKYYEDAGQVARVRAQQAGLRAGRTLANLLR